MPFRPLAAAFALLILGISQLDAVTFPLRWRWSNPRPHGNNIVDMAYSAAGGIAYQVAERGQLYLSRDLETWLPVDSGTTNALRAVCFLGSRTVVTGESGTVLYADADGVFHPGTLRSGATYDWLEAAAASSGLVVSVGDNGAVYTSTDGVNWQRQNSGVTDWLRGICYGVGGFVAVGESGRIIGSPNGTNWTTRPNANPAHLNRIGFSNGSYTAVGEGGVLLVSTNGGVTWKPPAVPAGATNDLFYVAYSNSDLLAVGDHEVKLFDGAGWSNELDRTNGPPAWVYYAAIGRPAPGFFLIGGRTGLLAEGYDGTPGSYVWYPSAVSPRTWLFDVAWVTNLFVAVGDLATVMTSGDGVDWSLESVPAPLTNTVFLGVGGTTNLLVAVGNRGGLMISPNLLTNIVVTNALGNVVTQTVSTLGILWQPVASLPTTNDLQGVALFNDLYVVAGDQGTILTSPDGTNWTQQITPTTNLLSSLAAFPGGMVATGDEGTILMSSNSVQWSRRTSGTTNWLYRVRYLNGTLIAVGQNGVVRTSSDGLSWAPRSSGVSNWLNDVAWIDGSYFIVGTQGTLLASGDAVSWTNVGTITLKSLYGAATDPHQLVTVGVEGVILRSPIVPDRTPPEILSYAHSVTTNRTSAQNLFLLGGKTDQQLTLDHRRAFDTNTWVVGPELELFDSSGTLYYLDSRPLSNAPPTEFYRATLVP